LLYSKRKQKSTYRQAEKCPKHGKSDQRRKVRKGQKEKKKDLKFYANLEGQNSVYFKLFNFTFQNVIAIFISA